MATITGIAQRATQAGMALRAAEATNGFVEAHMGEITAATNAMNIRANAHGFIQMLWDDAKLLLSVLTPILSNGNTCSEIYTQGINYIAYVELVRLIYAASKTTLNQFHQSNQLVKGYHNVLNSWDPVRLHTIELDIPFETSNIFDVTNKYVSIPYTMVDDKGQKHNRVLWAYPFVQANKLVKVEFWTDRKFLIDFLRGHSTETLENAKNYVLYMLVPMEVTKFSVLKNNSNDFIWTRTVKFINAIADKKKCSQNGTIDSWIHGEETMIDILPSCVIELYRDPKEPTRAVFSLPIGSSSQGVYGYEFYFVGGVKSKKFTDALTNVKDYVEFIQNPVDDKYLLPTDGDDFLTLFNENNDTFIKNAEILFDRVKMSFDNSWRVRFTKRGKLAKINLR